MEPAAEKVRWNGKGGVENTMQEVQVLSERQEVLKGLVKGQNQGEEQSNGKSITGRFF